MKNSYQEVIELLKEKKVTLGSCESLTGGLFASTITSFSGVSTFFKGGLVTYQNEVKENLLKIAKELIDEVGVVSYQVANMMAKKTRKLLNCDLAISFTGNAGPTTLEGKEVGLVYIGINYLDFEEVVECHFQGDRNSIQNQVVEQGFEIIKKILVKM